MEELIYNRTQVDIENKTAKGYYNISDLNRVETWCKYLAELLTSYGYSVRINAKTNWNITDFPYAEEMERIRLNVSKIKQAYYSYASMPAVPETLNKLDIEKANAIEKILADIDELIINMEFAFRKSGTFSSGGMEGLI